MPIEFKLTERIVGLSLHTATGAEKLSVEYGALVPSDDPTRVQHVLEGLQGCVFSRIPGFPDPSQVKSVVVVVRQDLSATAYINEVRLKAQVRVTRAVNKGEPVYTKDISDIQEVTLGVEVPDDAAVIVVTSIGWRRSVYFDFGPFTDNKLRIGPLSQILARQMLMLFGLADAAQATRTRVDAMADGFQTLQRLLRERCEDEAQYQELLEAHPWMLGGTYSEITRHKEHGHDPRGKRNIPDFTATRSSDHTHDIVELKQPFLTCFKQDGTPSSDFNDSWNQVVRYLAGAREDREYLARHHQLKFENPKCLLLIGHEWTEEQMRVVRQTESLNVSISVLRWDQLLTQATQVLSLMRIAAVPEQENEQSVNAGGILPQVPGTLAEITVGEHTDDEVEAGKT
jgi:hypothetical protein